MTPIRDTVTIPTALLEDLTNAAILYRAYRKRQGETRHDLDRMITESQQRLQCDPERAA